MVTQNLAYMTQSIQSFEAVAFSHVTKAHGSGFLIWASTIEFLTAIWEPSKSSSHAHPSPPKQNFYSRKQSIRIFKKNSHLSHCFF